MKNISFDRFMNPHDGSRKRSKTQVHKTKKEKELVRGKTKNIKAENIEDYIENFPTKYNIGFTSNEIEDVCKYLKIDRDSFNTALGINTCTMIDGEILTYHSDIINALHFIYNGKYIFWD